MTGIAVGNPAPETIAIMHSARFVEDALAPGTSLLEVGCGDGGLAAELIRRGFAVTGIDADAGCVARATARGVRAAHASWPRYEGSPVDAVAFTRSLHRMEPLSAALLGARRLLRPGGVALLEDLAFEDADAATLEWLMRVVREPAFAALRTHRAAAPRLLAHLESAADLLPAWRDYHLAHRVHDGRSMTAALVTAFAGCTTRAAPYLYRLLIPHVVATAAGTAFVAAVLERETRAIAAETIRPLGLRAVARV